MVTINEIQTQEGIMVRSGDVIIIDDDVAEDCKIYIAIRTEDDNFMLYNPNTFKYMLVKACYPEGCEMPDGVMEFSYIMARINSIYGIKNLRAHVVKRENIDYQLNIKVS